MSDLNSQHNRVVWLDIPVADLDRAVEFYKDVLHVPVSREKFEDTVFAVLHHDQGNGGCLIVRPDDIAPGKGPLIYLNCDGRIREAVALATVRGGSIVEDVHPIGPHGFRAIVNDSEGNRIALHSNTDA